MGYAISTYAYGPTEEIATQALIATLKVGGYHIIEAEADFIIISNYGKYRFIYEEIRADVIKANIFWLSEI